MKPAHWLVKQEPDSYAWADLVVCRAGALTVSELACAGVAGILVPYPHAVDDHQTMNAKFLTARGAAILLVISHNWAEFSRGGQLTTVFAALALIQGAGLWCFHTGRERGAIIGTLEARREFTKPQLRALSVLCPSPRILTPPVATQPQRRTFKIGGAK